MGWYSLIDKRNITKKIIDKRLIIFNHNKKNKTVYICFADFKDDKIISQEEAIFEEEGIYKILKKWLVKF